MDKVKQAAAVYERIKDKLKGQEGKIVAIEADSGEYFIGSNTIDAYEKAHKKFPNKKFFFERVGAKAAYFVGAL